MVWRAAQRRCTAPTRQAPAVLLAVWLSDTSSRPHCNATTSLCQLQELKIYRSVQLAVSLGRGSSHPVLQAAAVHSERKHTWVVCSCLGWSACTDRLGRAGSSLARVDKGRCRPRQRTGVAAAGAAVTCITHSAISVEHSFPNTQSSIGSELLAQAAKLERAAGQRDRLLRSPNAGEVTSNPSTARAALSAVRKGALEPPRRTPQNAHRPLLTAMHQQHD